jgi:hypothetical protein
MKLVKFRGLVFRLEIYTYARVWSSPKVAVKSQYIVTNGFMQTLTIYTQRHGTTSYRRASNDEFARNVLVRSLVLRCILDLDFQTAQRHTKMAVFV